MSGTTAALFRRWREEIAEEMAAVCQALTTARGLLPAAGAAAAAERRQREEMTALMQTGVGQRAIAGAFAARLAAARSDTPIAAAEALRREIAGLEWTLSDLVDAVGQIDRALAPVSATEAAAGSGEHLRRREPEPFEPIVMPVQLHRDSDGDGAVVTLRPRGAAA